MMQKWKVASLVSRWNMQRNSFPHRSCFFSSYLNGDRDLVVQDDAYTADLVPDAALIDPLKRVINVIGPAFDAWSGLLC